MGTIYTIGHSTRPFEAFVELLRSHDVGLLLDCRTVPRSRHNPQYDRPTLEPAVEAEGIGYRHEPRLGGLRKPLADSPNSAWRNASFRGYADHMQTPEFGEAIDDLRAVTATRSVAVMCAEGNPFRCHRSLVADALLARGVESFEITGAGRAKANGLTSFARVEGDRVTYPEEG